MLPLSSSITPAKPALVLAPMEGVTDAPMRQLLTEIAPYTHCVTEFLRISQDVPPEYVFTRHARELNFDSRTAAGVPVIFQLLGGDADKLARAALAAARAGACGIDLNFGCPAQTVNRHDGGATLLKYPLRIREIVSAVRAAVPVEISVSAKLRLGWDNLEAIHENAAMAVEGGADWITVHGRTKMQGYTPPAYWAPIGELRKNLKVPVIANGEIWSLEDFKRCRDETGCIHYMLGRGALANPYLPFQIAGELGIDTRGCVPAAHHADGLFPRHETWRELTSKFMTLGSSFSQNPHYTLGRLKQWFKLVNSQRPVAEMERLKRMQTFEEFHEIMSSSAAIT